MSGRKARVLPFAGAPRGDGDLRVSETELRTHCHTLVITRYFVKMFAPSTAKELSSAEIQTWFTTRERLFCRYTLPSLVQQTIQSKTWLIFVEKGYAALLPAALTDSSIPFVEVVEVDSAAENFEDFAAGISRRIDEWLGNLRSSGVADPMVSVCRIDNDDAFSKDFLETVNRIGLSHRRKGMDGALVTLPHGLQYHERRGLRSYLFNNNHFLSSFHFRERREGRHVHAISFNHSNLFLQRTPLLITNTDLPMWVEVVHDSNVSNRYRADLPLAESDLLDRRFGCVLRALPTAPQRETRTATAVQSSLPDMSFGRMLAIQNRCRAMKPNEYLQAYADILATAKVRSMFEIGVHEGGSLRFWREIYGDELKLYGLDIKPDCARFAPFPANEIFVGSQVDDQLLDSIVARCGSFDLLVDDGSHRNDHMWKSFTRLFAAVVPGGRYVIEDAYTSYWRRYGGGLRRPDSLIERSKEKIDEMFARFLGPKYARHHHSRDSGSAVHSDLADTIDSVAFYRCGLVVFRKTGGPS